jgi:diguanylate cyclase (GGDEF)-like protein
MMSDSADPPIDPAVARAGERADLAEDNAAADADQAAADADQAAADTDQAAALRDREDAARDQQASDEDQASADQSHVEASETAARSTYEATRLARETTTMHRVVTHAERSVAAHLRLVAASDRDTAASRRDETAHRRDLRSEMNERLIATSDVPLAEKFEQLRARAAADRARAARDRAAAARERARLEIELLGAHLDDLTGAHRREVGALALKVDIDRARRADGRFVLAFVDVDDLKGVNDRDGHAAGDKVLATLVRILRSNLRSFDTVVRYGGDEFVCGIGGMSVEDAGSRLELVDRLVLAEVGTGISVGLATLGADETLDELMARADAELLAAKQRLHPGPGR